MADKKLTEEIQSIVQSQNVTTEQLIQGVDILHRIAPSNMVYMRWQQLVASRPLYLKEHILADKLRIDGERSAVGTSDRYLLTYFH